MDDETMVLCTDCDDSGWRIVDCSGEVLADARALCSRPRRHLPHQFATPCDCRATNPQYQAKRERRIARAA